MGRAAPGGGVRLPIVIAGKGTGSGDKTLQFGAPWSTATGPPDSMRRRCPGPETITSMEGWSSS